MQVNLKPGQWPNLPRMLVTIKEAGFTAVPEQVELVVSGKVAREGDQLVLVLDRLKTPVSLPITAARENPETAAHLARHVGETVDLEGLWQPAPTGQTGPGQLAVTLISGPDDK